MIERTRPKFLGMIMPTVAGVVAGVCASTLASRPAPHPHSATGPDRAIAARAEPSTAQATPARRDAADVVRLAALEQRLAALEQPPASEPATQAAQAEQDISPDAARAQEEARFAEVIEAHERQSRDHVWADSSARTLGAEISSLAEHGAFRLIGVDCRTTSCVGLVQWPSYNQAVREFPMLLSHFYGLNCARSTQLMEPSDHEAPYQARVFFECGRSRGVNGS